MDLAFRATQPDEFGELILAIDGAFVGRFDAEDVARERAVSDPERCFAAFEGAEIVGGAYDARLPMAVPGGRLLEATAAVVGVGVKPTHTRRGVNTALMRLQLEAMRERGDAVAILHASEGAIYGRFGYGLATFETRLDLERTHGRFVRGVEPMGRVRLVGREEARAAIAAVEAVLRTEVPGMVAADDAGWFDYRFPERHGGESSHLSFALHETDGVVDAYAAYAMRHAWPESVPRNELDVWGIAGATPAAYADMWRYCIGIDLVERVRTDHRPVDDAILHLLAEPRRAGARILDGIWLRLVDLPAALEARGYAGEGSVVLAVADAFCPWNEGTYRLEVAGGEATCRATSEEPDLACTTNDLAAAYLGGSTFRQLHAATRIHELRDGAIGEADRLFRTDRSPWCQAMF